MALYAPLLASRFTWRNLESARDSEDVDGVDTEVAQAREERINGVLDDVAVPLCGNDGDSGHVYSFDPLPSGL